MRDLRHATIIEYLQLCIRYRIALDAASPYEWARTMGYPARSSLAHIITGQMAAAGRKLNCAAGHDLIAANWPQWAENPGYVSGL